MPGWRWLRNDSLNAFHKVPDNPDVLPSFTARGWEPVDIDGDLHEDDVEFAEALERLERSKSEEQDPEEDPTIEAPPAAAEKGSEV